MSETQSRMKMGILLIAVLAGTLLRLSYFEKEGGDHQTYKEAVGMLLSGENPYKYTVESYQDIEQKRGFATLPTLMYVQALFIKINGVFNGDWPTKLMWKIPVLLADIGIVAFLVRKFYKKDYYLALFTTVFWLFNPHILVRGEYTLYDPLSIVFLLLSMKSITKNSWLSGLYLAISISFKSFPVIFLPLFVLKSKNKVAFVTAGILFALVISLPFAKDMENLRYYIQGTTQVHADRGVQGRPILTFLSYYGENIGLNFNQQVNAKTYAFLAMIVPWVAGVLIFVKYQKWSIFKLALLPIATYYLLTPVLNRTHLLWFLPIFLIGGYELLRERGMKVFYVAMFALYLSLAGYLQLWSRGFHIYGCDMVSIAPTEKASTRTCSRLDTYGFSHCPVEAGKCLPHCCIN